MPPSGPWDGLLFELRGAALEANLGPQLDGAALEANLEQQREEDVALEAIYAQDVTATNAEVAATCALEVGAVVELAGGQERRLASLPPLSLRAWRPARYPSDAAPAFGLRCAWLSDAQLAALATRLDELWEEQGPGAGILLSWIEWLRHESAAFLFGDAAAGDALRISLVPTDGGALLDPADAVAASGGRRAQRWPRSAAAAATAVLAHAEVAEEAAWAGEVHACAVCLDEKAGVDCVRFHSCGHTFCKGCIAGYFQSQVADGAVAELLCPEPSCRAAATPAEVKAVLSEEDYEAFERLSLQQSLQSMKDVFVCPRCEYPAILQEEGGRLAICGECSFSFCVECRCAWHGLSACANLAARWRKAGPAERDALTAKYGAKMVEEVQSAELIEGTTKPCVNCGTPIEKNGGCNHITCRHCRYQWCWLCGMTYKPGHYKNGPCEQFSDDFFEEAGLTREEFARDWVVFDHQ